MELPYNPAVPLLGIYSKKTIITKDTCTIMFTEPLFKISFSLRMCGCMPVLLQSCPTLCDPMDCSPPGSSVHGILQERILE